MFRTMFAGAAVIAMLTGAALSDTNTADTAIVGGWTEDQATIITEDIQAMFDEATEKLIGVNYEMIDLIETQIVSGTNYRFLAEKQAVYPGAEKEQVIVTIHKALDGTLSVPDVTAK